VPRRAPAPVAASVSGPERHRARLKEGLAMAERYVDGIMEDLQFNDRHNPSQDEATFAIYQFLMEDRDPTDELDALAGSQDAGYLMGLAIGRRLAGGRHAS
jgi:hypothetical protein